MKRVFFTLFALIIVVFWATPEIAHAGKPQPVCGDGRCGSGEATTTCPQDCPAPICIIDGICNPGETCESCPNDCGSTGKGNKKLCCGKNGYCDLLVCGNHDTDTTADCQDYCPTDGGKIIAGICGCGLPDDDSDHDGTPDCNDGCPNDLNKMAQGERGCGLEEGVTATVQAGLGATLSVTGGRLVIPADALTAGTELTLMQTPVDQSQFPASNFPNDQAITSVFTITSSKAQGAKVLLKVEIDIPDSAPAGFYGRVKSQGDISPDGQADWALDIGHFDPATRTLIFPLISAATQFDFIVVTKAAPVATRGEFIRIARNTVSRLFNFASQLLISTAYAQEMGEELPKHTYDVIDWQNFGWAVVCDPGKVSCSQEILDSFAKRLYDTVQDIAINPDVGLGFKNARLVQVAKGDLDRAIGGGLSSGIFDPNPSGSLLLLLAYLEPDNDKYSGRYNGAIRVTETAALNSPMNNSENGDTIAHELFHAVQAYEIPLVMAFYLENAWILEGTAVAAGEATVTLDLQYRKDFRFYGYWRNWSEPLNSAENYVQYLVSEFFLQWGDMNYLRDVIKALGTAPELITATNSYQYVNNALPGGLPAAYTNLIKQRNEEAYPSEYVQDYACQIGVNCNGTDKIPIDAMSAHAFNLTVSGGEPTCPAGEMLQINKETTTLQLVVTGDGDDPADFKLLIGNTYHDPAPTIANLSETVTRLWVVNHYVGVLNENQGPMSANLSFFDFHVDRVFDYDCIPEPEVCGDGVCGGGETCPSCGDCCTSCADHELWKLLGDCYEYSCGCPGPGGTDCQWAATVQDNCCTNGLNPELFTRTDGTGCWRYHGNSLPTYIDGSGNEHCKKNIAIGNHDGYYWCNRTCWKNATPWNTWVTWTIYQDGSGGQTCI